MLSDTAPKIRNYGIVGDCRAAALVSKHGSIDWLCWPRFDSPSIFAALLDTDRGGRWSISPTQPFRTERCYVQDSNVLETRFECASGRATLTDLLPVATEEFKRKNLLPDHELIREVVCTEGDIELEICFCPRAVYGLKPAQIRGLSSWGLCIDVGRGSYWLRSSVPLRIQSDQACATLALKRGEALQFSLSYAEESPAVLVSLGEEMRSKVSRSVQWWQDWAGTCSYDGPYRDAVRRSALTLKLLAYAPSGAIIAAATTSLPEIVGADLNWDYRYCWLRDASMTIRALLGLGYVAEAESFLNWLLHATRLTQPELRILYTVFGDIAPRERELNCLNGYIGSRPVRVGNGARKQLQLDVYGEVIDAATHYVRYGGSLDRTTQKVLIGLGKYVAQNWTLPDEGIWEPRSERQHHTHSRLLCWTALDRLLALEEKGLLKGAPRELFAREQERIGVQIRRRAWNENLQSYVSVLDGNELDASLLRIPWYGFERADSERMKSTYRRVRERLGAGDGLLYRYKRQPPESAFGICGFWAAEYLALGGGTLEQAHDCFQQLLKYQNDLGLFGEEIEPSSGDALGNFPQAFTHVGLISTALSLQERERGESAPALSAPKNTELSGSEARL